MPILHGPGPCATNTGACLTSRPSWACSSTATAAELVKVGLVGKSGYDDLVHWRGVRIHSFQEGATLIRTEISAMGELSARFARRVHFGLSANIVLGRSEEDAIS